MSKDGMTKEHNYVQLDEDQRGIKGKARGKK